ncbi:expressed unknown protein [Seminavis robusta]|uniref:Uncharacterized protein n=2 Tax=Seminavis robusta TaxID=568900 RepID=A0A9N8EDM6_9STRA|nr:expressed unknown protein [Seminavis robusta]|eukprot:Sro1023_g232470.1 n/a (291) ;mRNA; f:5235-6107
MDTVTVESSNNVALNSSTPPLLTTKKAEEITVRMIDNNNNQSNHQLATIHDKILILKVPAGPEEPPKKRPASEASSSLPTKKARFVLVAPIGPAGAQRTVHFELEADGVKTRVRVFNRVEASETPDCWWSPSEMGEIQAREKSAVSVMSFCCEHYTSQVLSVLKEAHNTIKGMDSDSTVASPESVWVANSPARGLERDIVQGFKQRKRKVIRKVLESQRVLQQGRHCETGEAPPLEVQSNILSTQYRRWSYPMTRFAQVLAEGDAQVVVDNNNGGAGSTDPAGLPPLEAF